MFVQSDRFHLSSVFYNKNTPCNIVMIVTQPRPSNTKTLNILLVKNRKKNKEINRERFLVEKFKYVNCFKEQHSFVTFVKIG